MAPRRSSRDHPRIRGEHDGDLSRISHVAGSSPHTRGALDEPGDGHGGLRIIPAYAGSTTGRTGWRPLVRDHPRIRGEHLRAMVIVPSVVGSSPHTRGARGRPGLGGGCRTDHPRIRGEHVAEIPGKVVKAGSSPHTRGAPSVRLPATVVVGDHPRIRGEHRRDRGARIRQVGSSPHTRGALQVCPDPVVDEGIIPAYAGSTSKTPKNRSAPRDHPRIRGEHVLENVVDGAHGGSSPHTRGAPRETFEEVEGFRIIPAYAGSTTIPRMSFWCGRDHPRIRGEHTHAR